MEKYHICHVCGQHMYRCVKNKEYHLMDTIIAVPDVEFFQCEACGERILESQEVERIEKLIVRNIRKADDQK